MLELIKHQWRETTRSALWQKNAFVNFLMVLMFIYLGLNFAILGYLGGNLLMAAFPFESPISNLNAGIVYYFLIDLFLRFYMQPLPVIGIQPYLHLPIKKGKIINFLLWKSALNVFNTSVLVIAVPFAIRWIAKYESVSGAWAWVFAVYFFNLVNNYLITYLKKMFAEKPKVVLAFGGLIVGLIALEYFDLIQLSEASRWYFDTVIEQPVMALFPLGITLGVYAFVYRFFRKNAYLGTLSEHKKQKVQTGDLAFLHRFNTIGKLIELELKLIWRNKRPKSVATLSIFFFLYGFFIYPAGHSPFLYIIGGLLVTGMFMLNYGQFLIGWEGNYFDVLLARNISIREYLLGKYYLFAVSVAINFVLSFVYLYFGWKIVLYNFAISLFNIGVISIVVIYFATIGPKKIDLSKSTFFNYQGTGASQFLLMAPVLGLPIVIYSIFSFISESAGIISLLAVGAMGIAMHRPLINMLERRLKEKKHEIAANFRES